MSRTSLKERNKAIRKAWEKEQLLVQEGKGTRDWTSEQQKDILDPTKGKAYDDQGRAFEGQHMKSAAEYPEEQGNPDNIQFLTRDEHLEAHKGSWQNPTNWYYDPVTKEFFDFGEGPVIPCNIIILSDPLCIPVIESSINISEETTITEEESENSAPHLAGDSNKSSVKETNPSRSKQIFSNNTKMLNLKSNFIRTIKGVGQFIHEHPAESIEMLITAITLTSQILSWHSDNKNTSHTPAETGSSTPLNTKPDYKSAIEDVVDKATRNPPHENDVIGHWQRYHTKEGIKWVKKAPYHRGGNSNS